MSWDKEGNLICDWCNKIVIPFYKVTEEAKEVNQGWTKCSECCLKSSPFPKEGNISDLPDDFWAPNDPMRKILNES